MTKHALHRVVSTSRDDDLDYYLLMSPDASQDAQAPSCSSTSYDAFGLKRLTARCSSYQTPKCELKVATGVQPS